MILSILIPTTPDREYFLHRLHSQINDQLFHLANKTLEPYFGGALNVHYFQWADPVTRSLGCEVEVIVFSDLKTMTIGKKRNLLLEYATGEYVAFVDDDDLITDNYFDLILTALMTKPDCCSLKGIITEDGQNPLVFEHSIKYKAYKTNPEGLPVRYERYPNHLNTIKSSIAKQFRFPEKNHGEDTDFATQIFNSGLLKTEAYIEDTLYYYQYRSKK